MDSHPMTDEQHQAIAQITNHQIQLLTLRLTRKYGQAIALDAIDAAFVQICENYDPQHPSHASANTLLVKYAETQALTLIKQSEQTNPILSLDQDDEFLSSDGHQSLHELIADAKADIDLQFDDSEALAPIRLLMMVEKVIAKLHEMRLFADSASERYGCKVALKVLEVCKEMVDAGVLDSESELGYGSRTNLSILIASVSNLSATTVHYVAMTKLREAVRLALPEQTRGW